MKRTVCSLAALLALAAPLFAVYDWQPLQENNFMMAITNHGRLGQVMGGADAYAFWPAPAIDANGNLVPPLMNYIYGWGLWIGAQVPNDSLPGKIDTLVTMGYNPANGNYEYTPGAVIDGVPQDRYDPTVKIYRSDEADWPLKKTNGQDSILSLLDTRCVYNDWYSPQHQAGGKPLKVEVTQATYQFSGKLLTWKTLSFSFGRLGIPGTIPCGTSTWRQWRIVTSAMKAAPMLTMSAGSIPPLTWHSNFKSTASRLVGLKTLVA